MTVAARASPLAAHLARGPWRWLAKAPLRYDRDAQELETFVVRERRAFPGRTCDDEPVGPVVEEELRKLAKALVIDRAARIERRNDRGQDLAEHGA